MDSSGSVALDQFSNTTSNLPLCSMPPFGSVAYSSFDGNSLIVTSMPSFDHCSCAKTCAAAAVA
jgi:hypothetical protein